MLFEGFWRFPLLYWTNFYVFRNIAIGITLIRGPANTRGMLRYEVLEHTADLMIRAYGSTLEECYANMCYGMFDQTVALDGVRSLHRFRVEVDGVDDEDALYSLLSELLYLECTEGMVLCEFSVTIDGTHISCDAKGEALDWDRMEVRGEIKAVTFHDMEIDAGKPEVTVLFDVRSPHAPYVLARKHTS